MLIGIDLDNVLADLAPALIKFHNNFFDASLEVNQIFSHNLWQVWGGTPEETIEKVYNFYKSDYFKNILPVNGSVEGVTDLARNHNLVVITSRPHFLADETKSWVYKHFTDKFSGIHLTNQFSLGESRKKSEICSELGVDVLIEDSLEFAMDCATKTKVLLFDSPWNQKELPDGIIRVHSWKDIVDSISKLERTDTKNLDKLEF